MSLWADMKIKTQNAKNGVTPTLNLVLRKDLILNTPNREVRLEWWKWKKFYMERHYEGSHILFLESRAQSMSLQICISFFTIYSGSNIWYMYKILNIYEKTHSRYLNSKLRIQIVWLTCKRFHFCKCPRFHFCKCPLKNTEQMTWNKLAITLIYKLKLNTSVNWASFDINHHLSLPLCEMV